MEVTSVTCKGCGAALNEAPNAVRQPCPHCGSTAREFAASGMAVVRTVGSVEAVVERGVNEMRATVLFLLLTIGLTVGFGAPWSWWARLVGAVVAVVASAASVAIALRYPPVRKSVMRLMHVLTGQ
jgi:hypothetical protein